VQHFWPKVCDGQKSGLQVLEPPLPPLDIAPLPPKPPVAAPPLAELPPVPGGNIVVSSSLLAHDAAMAATASQPP
jgi:hypothetical protein